MFSTVYYFDYSIQDLQVASRFGHNTPQQGDFDQFGNSMLFNGELDFLGGVISNNSFAKLCPANAPLLDFSVVLTANKEATDKLIKTAGSKFGVPLAMGWSTHTVENFWPVTILWPDSYPVVLLPGYSYNFKATVQIQPVLDVNVFGQSHISGWLNSTSTSFDQVQSDILNANTAIIRLQITFVRDTTTRKYYVVYSIFDFISGVGSAVALFQLGMVFLTVWQKVTLPERGSDLGLNPYLNYDVGVNDSSETVM